MRLLAISDLHLGHEANRRGLTAVPPHPDDWLLLAGDVGERPAHLLFALEVLCRRFRRLVWVPGNHDLWTAPGDPAAARGVAKYRELVEICRRYGVATPEDPFPVWDGPGGPVTVAPLFVLYDYTFAPDGVAATDAVEWAAATGVVCADEAYLHPDPHPSRAAWCAERVRASEERLRQAAGERPFVLVNHFPLHREHAVLPRVPRFQVWCGTRRTEPWPEEFGAEVVVHGHLHIRATRRRDGVRYEEVSLGYPKQWRPERGVETYLRQVLPAPEADAAGTGPR